MQKFCALASPSHRPVKKPRLHLFPPTPLSLPELPPEVLVQIVRYVFVGDHIDDDPAKLSASVRSLVNLSIVNSRLYHFCRHLLVNTFSASLRDLCAGQISCDRCVRKQRPVPPPTPGQVVSDVRPVAVGRWYGLTRSRLSLLKNIPVRSVDLNPQSLCRHYLTYAISVLQQKSTSTLRHFGGIRDPHTVWPPFPDLLRPFKYLRSLIIHNPSSTTLHSINTLEQLHHLKLHNVAHSLRYSIQYALSPEKGAIFRSFHVTCARPEEEPVPAQGQQAGTPYNIRLSIFPHRQNHVDSSNEDPNGIDHNADGKDARCIVGHITTNFLRRLLPLSHIDSLMTAQIPSPFATTRSACTLCVFDSRLDTSYRIDEEALLPNAPIIRVHAKVRRMQKHKNLMDLLNELHLPELPFKYRAFVDSFFGSVEVPTPWNSFTRTRVDTLRRQALHNLDPIANCQQTPDVPTLVRIKMTDWLVPRYLSFTARREEANTIQYRVRTIEFDDMSRSDVYASQGPYDCLRYEVPIISFEMMDHLSFLLPIPSSGTRTENTFIARDSFHMDTDCSCRERVAIYEINRLMKLACEVISLASQLKVFIVSVGFLWALKRREKLERFFRHAPAMQRLHIEPSQNLSLCRRDNRGLFGRAYRGEDITTAQEAFADMDGGINARGGYVPFRSRGYGTSGGRGYFRGRGHGRGRGRDRGRGRGEIHEDFGRGSPRDDLPRHSAGAEGDLVGGAGSVTVDTVGGAGHKTNEKDRTEESIEKWDDRSMTDLIKILPNVLDSVGVFCKHLTRIEIHDAHTMHRRGTRKAEWRFSVKEYGEGSSFEDKAMDLSESWAALHRLMQKQYDHLIYGDELQNRVQRIGHRLDVSSVQMVLQQWQRTLSVGRKAESDGFRRPYPNW